MGFVFVQKKTLKHYSVLSCASLPLENAISEGKMYEQSMEIELPICSDKDATRSDGKHDELWEKKIQKGFDMESKFTQQRG